MDLFSGSVAPENGGKPSHDLENWTTEDGLARFVSVHPLRLSEEEPERPA